LRKINYFDSDFWIRSCFALPTDSVVDRHRFDADPDQNFHFGADPFPDPDSDWHQNDADPHADPTPSFTHAGKWDKMLLLFNNSSILTS
jgi:hypothetical protein